VALDEVHESAENVPRRLMRSLIGVSSERKRHSVIYQTPMQYEAETLGGMLLEDRT
jgi:hypothetical protein